MSVIPSCFRFVNMLAPGMSPVEVQPKIPDLLLIAFTLCGLTGRFLFVW
jgi:hypothetical protein